MCKCMRMFRNALICAITAPVAILVIKEITETIVFEWIS